MGKWVHIIGICGSGTSGLACMLKEKGFKVTGSDSSFYPPANLILEKAGIIGMEGYKDSNIGTPDLVIEATACGKDNPEVNLAKEKGLKIISFPEALGEIFLKDVSSIVIAGTHGKTTISSLLAWILENAGFDPSFLIGGVPINFGTNYKLCTTKYFVIEGDEYISSRDNPTPKFCYYQPKIALISNIELDHIDTYGNLEDIKSAFRHLVDLIPKNGSLIVGADNQHVLDVAKGARCQVTTYGISEDSDWKATHIQLSETGACFEVINRDKPTGRFSTKLAGMHNVKNALGAIAVAKTLSISNMDIQKAFDSFKGTKKRLEVIEVVNEVTIIDDYAHHPTEVKETLSALKTRYPNNRIFCVFEPRTHSSRRRRFMAEYASSFLEATEVIITPVYKPQDLDKEDMLDPEELVKMMKNAQYIPSMDGIIDYLLKGLSKGDVVVFMSPGDFSRTYNKLIKGFCTIENGDL
ncbi:MAG: UDP-N-acetylmuramate--L-alanine ligase [bacterium]|nr:UDP-N-acetylmuramate--L-alanine ligase [bacterium]